MWRIRDLHIRVERPTSWVNSFFIRFQGTTWASEHTHRPARLWALPCFFPLSSSVWPLPLFRWKMGLGLLLWHHFLVLKHKEEMENFTKETRQATRHHAVTLVFRQLFSKCPEVLNILIFLPLKGENNLCHEPESMNPGMCHFINTPLSYRRPLSNWSPLR